MILSLKKLGIRLMLMLCAYSTSLNAQNLPNYKLGQAIENFSMFDMNSTRFTTKNVKSKNIIVLVFISNECKYSENVNTSINHIFDLHKDEVEIWAVNSFNPNIYPNENEEKMREFADQKGLKPPYLVDLGKNIADRFSVKQVPSAVILWKEGDSFKYVYNGAIVETINGKPYTILEQNISNLLSGKKVISSKSKNLVCQID